MNNIDIIKTVCLTEKATLLTEAHNKYVFKVHPKANKLEIRKAVEQLFGKKVTSVNTCFYKGKLKRERTAHYGRRPSWKKAIVTLAPGEKIDFI